MKSQMFSIVITEDEAGYLVARAPELPGCHTQARSLPQLLKRMEEAIALCIEVQKQKKITANRERFVGVQQLALSL